MFQIMGFYIIYIWFKDMFSISMNRSDGNQALISFILKWVENLCDVGIMYIYIT